MSSEKKRSRGRKGQSDTDLVTQDALPRIPSDEYDAECYATEYGTSWGRKKHLYVKFTLIDPHYDGTKLHMVIAEPPNLTFRTKKWTQWSLAMGRQPSKGERFNKDIFVGKQYVVMVRETKRPLSKKTLMPQHMQYSVIDTILKVTDRKTL